MSCLYFDGCLNKSFVNENVFFQLNIDIFSLCYVFQRYKDTLIVYHILDIIDIHVEINFLTFRFLAVLFCFFFFHSYRTALMCL